MEKRTREILALVILVALGMAAAGAMGWYMLVGHSWNVTATHIDDYVGEMEGYTVILADGVVPVNASPKPSAASREAPAGASAPSAEASAPASPAGSRAATNEWQNGSGSAQSEASASAEDGQGAALEPYEEHVPVYAQGIAESYRDKGAEVIVLDSRRFSRYDDPAILQRGSKRYGIFSVGGPLAFPHALSRVAYLKRHRVDEIICLTDEPRMLKAVNVGVDMFVFCRDAGLPSDGTTVHRAFCVDLPYVGEVQAIILSPSGVASAKTITQP